MGLTIVTDQVEISSEVKDLSFIIGEFNNEDVQNENELNMVLAGIEKKIKVEEDYFEENLGYNTYKFNEIWTNEFMSYTKQAFESIKKVYIDRYLAFSRLKALLKSPNRFSGNYNLSLEYFNYVLNSIRKSESKNIKILGHKRAIQDLNRLLGTNNESLKNVELIGISGFHRDVLVFINEDVVIDRKVLNEDYGVALVYKDGFTDYNDLIGSVLRIFPEEFSSNDLNSVAILGLNPENSCEECVNNWISTIGKYWRITD